MKLLFSKPVTKFFLFCCIGMIVHSCMPAFLKPAKQFVLNSDSIAVMVIPADNILYTNIKTDLIEGYDSLSAEQKLVAMKEQSLLLSQLTDSIIYVSFVNKYIYYLTQTSLKVYTQEYDYLFESNKKKSVVKLAQIECEEYFDKVRDEDVINDAYLVYNDAYVNAFAFNLWVECTSPYNDTATVLFANNRITDKHYGWFEQDWNGNVLYYENNVELDLQRVENFLNKLAERYANYTFDYLLNNYINSTMATPEIPDSSSLHFDIQSGKFYYVDDNYKFIKL